MTNSNEVLAKLTGYKSNGIHTFCVNNNIVVSGNSIQSDLFGQHVEHSISTTGKDALASLELGARLKLCTTLEQVQQRITEYGTGVYAQNKGKGESTVVVPTFSIPDSIEQLPVDTITKAIGNDHTVVLSTAQLVQLGLFDTLSSADIDSLTASLASIQADAEKLKILVTLFGITTATVEYEDSNSIEYTCTVSDTAWSTVWRKVKSSLHEGWTVTAPDMEMSGDSISYSFTLTHDTTYTVV